MPKNINLSKKKISEPCYSIVGFGHVKQTNIIVTTDLKEARLRFKKEIEKPQYPKIILFRHSDKGDRKLTTWQFKEEINYDKHL